MPGLHFVAADRPVAEEVTAALQPVGLGRDQARVLWSNDSACLAAKACPEYPVSFWRDDEFEYALEGVVYGLGDAGLKTAVAALADLVFRQGRPQDRLAAWLRDKDGHFLIWIRDVKSGGVAIINDIFSSLPAYYLKAPAGAAVSRDARFLHHFAGPLSFDRLGLAQWLALGGPREGTTLWRGVHRLLPASLLSIDPEGELRTEVLFTFDFSRKARRGRSIEENASDLADLFLEACRRRMTGAENLVSLSGGLDSRAVAAGLAACGGEISAATYDKKGKEAEVALAKEIASRLGLPWRSVKVPGVTGRSARTLLQAKNGLNNLGLGFVCEFYQHLVDSYAPGATLYTGDGGDRTLPPIVPVKPIRGLRGLSRHILDYEYYEELCLPHEDAAALCGLAPRDLVDALTEQLAQYPEDDMDMKFVHYSMYCEAYGYLFEGQDRNRFYFWNAAPFYSQPFFEEALACPDDQKEYYELYRRFLDRLSPLISDTAYSNLGAPLTSPKIKSRVRRFNLKARFPRAMRLAKRIIKGEDVLPADSVIPELIEKQIAACPAVGETLNVDHIRRMAGDRKRYHRQTVMNLLTMTSIIEDLSRGESSLAEYADQEL